MNDAYDTMVVIPARGGSERIPQKNLAEFWGKPLLQWAIEYAQAEGFDPTVLTDNAEIAEYARRCGAAIYDLPAEYAGPDSVSYDSAAWLSRQTMANAVILQPTSPVRPLGLVGQVVKLLADYDTVYTGCRLPVQFVFNLEGRCVNGRLEADGQHPRSQDLTGDPHFMPTGQAAGISYQFANKVRPFYSAPRLGVVEVPWQTAVDVDYPEDLQRPTVVVVGNAANLRDKRLGWVIDGYDVVIRCNLYEIEGYEAQVGTKTTHWCRAPNGGIQAKSAWRADCSGLTEVWMVWGRIADKDRVPYEEAYRGQLSGVKREVTLDNSKVKEFAFEHPPSSGFMAVLHALERWGEPIDVVGFGPRERIEPGHYSELKSRPAPVNHDFDAERKYLNDLEASGRIRRLD